MVVSSGVSYNPVLKISLNSSADYSAEETNVAVIVGEDHEGTRAGTGEAGIGIMINNPAEDEQMEVIVVGTAPARVGSAVVYGNLLKIDTLGEVVPVASNNDYIIGMAMQDGADGDIIEIFLMQGYYGA